MRREVQKVAEHCLRPRPHLYMFAEKNAKDAARTEDMINASDFQRRTCEKQNRREKRIEKLTDRYINEEIPASRFLDEISRMYAPVTNE